MISQSELRAGLSDDELDELDAFLTSRCVPHDGMTLSMLDGYLTAIVSGPELPAPSAWLSQVWGQEESGEDGFAFTSIEEAKHVHSLVLRRLNEISRDFERGEINPIFLGSENSEVADMWCLGYIHAIRLRSQSWAPLLRGEDENAMLLFPISAIASRWLQPASEEQEKMLHAYLNDEKQAELTKRVPHAAYDLYRYWREHRALPSTTIRSSPRPGRNELCPCGSTKKYKKCCG